MNFTECAKEVLDIEASGLLNAKDNIGFEFNDIVKAILRMKGRVVVTGMGKSGLVGKKIAATLSSTGTRSFFLHPGEAYHGDLGAISQSDVVLAISNSGDTEEVIRLLSFFKDNGNIVIAMCAKKNSMLANHSDFLIDISIPKEACPLELAPTTSTTLTMALGDALAVALMKGRGFKAENFARFHPGGSLGRKLLLKVKDIMKKENLPILHESDAFEKVVSTIGSGRMGVAIVIKDQKAVGIITDGDLRRSLEKNKEKSFKMKVMDIMTSNPIEIRPDEKIVFAQELMNSKKISSLIVSDEHKNFLGLLNLYDL